MRKIVILGAGAGGTIVANMLRQKLPESEWQIVIIDRDDRHHYQAGYHFGFQTMRCWRPGRI